MFSLGFSRNLPLHEKKKSFFTGCHDASEIARRHRVNEIQKDSKIVSKKIDYFSIQNALRKVRAGGYTVPPKVSIMTSNIFMTSLYNKPPLIRSAKGRSPLAHHDDKHTTFV